MKNTTIPVDLMSELKEAVERITRGQSDPAAMRRASERMDLLCEELRQKHGEMNVVEDLIHEIREEE